VDIQPIAESSAIAGPDWWRHFSAPPISDVDVMLFSRQDRKSDEPLVW
jgi:hypothetical protein